MTDVSGNADLELDDALLTAIGNSQNALAESMSEAQGNMLAMGDTVLSETEYTLSEEMIANAISDNYFACDGRTANCSISKISVRESLLTGWVKQSC